MLKKADWWNMLKHTSVHPTCFRSTGLQFAFNLIYYDFTFRNVAKEESLIKRKEQQSPGLFELFFFLS